MRNLLVVVAAGALAAVVYMVHWTMLFTSDHTLTVWRAIFQMLAAIASIAALIFSIATWRRASTVQHYGELDRMYSDLLKLAIDSPEFRNPSAVRDPKEQRQYDTYALMVWTFLETVADRCPRATHLCETWYPAADAEAELHKAWFNRRENRALFKPRFLTFMQKGTFKSHCPVIAEGTGA